jgi:hypothetical protein
VGSWVRPPLIGSFVAGEIIPVLGTRLESSEFCGGTSYSSAQTRSTIYRLMFIVVLLLNVIRHAGTKASPCK